MNIVMSVHSTILVLLISAAAALLTGCDLPRDQKGALDRIATSRQIRVGLVSNEPWVVRRPDGSPSGSEVELVQKFAAELGATPEWKWENEPDAMEALLHHELDLVVGGITDQTLWKNEVGLTAPYFTDHIVVGVPAGSSPTSNIEGKNVTVEADDIAALTLVSEQKGIPVRIASLDPTQPAAARDWRLEQLGFTLAEIDLRRDRHVLAVPPGENAFLVRLERFLKTQRPEIKNMLQRHAAEASK